MEKEHEYCDCLSESPYAASESSFNYKTETMPDGKRRVVQPKIICVICNKERGQAVEIKQ